MKHLLVRPAKLLFSCLLLAATIPNAAAAGPSESLVVMTYNLRYASSRPPNAWPDRRPIMKECLREIMPDILGSQEGLYQQLKDLASDLPEYEWIGLGREGGSRGEFMAVFFKGDRLEPLEFDHFWLSDTPSVIGSTTWGNSNRRMVTWIRFRDRVTHREFYLLNTHFDHQIQAAREKSAALVRERVGALNPLLPVIFTGDFNAVAEANPAYTTLVGDGFFADTWKTAAVHEGDATLNSFNDFKPALHDAKRIDWILTRGPVQAETIRVVDCSRHGQYPSDHFPVVTRLILDGAARP